MDSFERFELPPEARALLKKLLVDHGLLELARERAGDLRLAGKWATWLTIGITVAANLLTSVVESD